MEIKYTATTTDIARAKIATWAYRQYILKLAPKCNYQLDTPEETLMRFGKIGVITMTIEYNEYIFEGTGIQ